MKNNTAQIIQVLCDGDKNHPARSRVKVWDLLNQVNNDALDTLDGVEHED